MTYIKLNKNKRPLHKWGEKTYTLEDVKNEDNYGMVVPEPFVVIDVDNQEDFERLFKIVTDRDLQVRVMKTDSGGHFWFKSLKPITNHVGINTPITIPVDIRSYGKKSYVVLKKDGVERKWLKNPKDVDELPYWLQPNKQLTKDLRGMDEGAGRNTALFSYIIPLINQRFSKEQVEETFNIINEYVFADPLRPAEISAMMDNDIFNDSRALFFAGPKFLHHEFAQWLKSTHFIKLYAGELWVYKDGLYVNDDRYLQKLMIQQIPELTTKMRKETLDYLKLLGSSAIRNSPATTINVPNGLLDTTTGRLEKHSPFVFTTNQLPAVYDPKAYSEIVDKTLDRVTCNDKDLRLLLEEMIGYILYGENIFQKAFILTGEGSNGKSSFMKMITNFVGDKNISSLTLGELEQRFKAPELVGKLVNLGDDIPKELLRDTSVFKRAVTGDPISTERKNQDGFTFSNRAKLIFTANQLPPSTDKSHGFLRRMVIIPFHATFTPDDPDYDPDIDEKLCTPEAASYLLNVAIEGLNRLVKRGKFIEVESVDRMLREYEAANNSAVAWLEEGNEILNRSTQEVYQDYMLYCASVQAKPYSTTRFNREIRVKYGYESKRESHKGKTVTIWREQ